jgi:redox-sensitive bicupin YhaK (pirin superfamily)
LPIRADARVMGATVKAGESVSHTVGEGRHAYLVPATGAVEILGERYEARDGIAISGGQTVEIKALDNAELVLVDAD